MSQKPNYLKLLVALENLHQPSKINALPDEHVGLFRAGEMFATAVCDAIMGAYEQQPNVSKPKIRMTGGPDYDLLKVIERDGAYQAQSAEERWIMRDLALIGYIKLVWGHDNKYVLTRKGYEIISDD